MEVVLIQLLPFTCFVKAAFDNKIDILCLKQRERGKVYWGRMLCMKTIGYLNTALGGNHCFTLLGNPRKTGLQLFRCRIQNTSKKKKKGYSKNYFGLTYISNLGRDLLVSKNHNVLFLCSYQNLTSVTQIFPS